MFLLNLLFLCLFIVFIPMLFDNKLRSEQQKKWIFIILTVSSVIFCLNKPIFFIEGFQYDLRNIAVIIGGLYGGIPAIIVLWITTIVARILIGGSGIYSTFFVSSFLSIVTIYVYKKFQYASMKRKLVIGMIYALSYIMLIITIVMIGFHVKLPISVMITLISYEILAIIIVIYLKEYVREASLIKHRVLKAEKMEIVSYLASSISHEVRNPLTVVRGFLQMMLSVELEKDKKEEYLKLSISEIDRANRIIGDYLNFAKPNIENKEVLNVTEEIGRVKEIITPLANMNSVNIETSLETGHIVGASRLFQQCLLNITKNCIEAMPDGGMLTILAKEQKHNIVIYIEDTGNGMTQEQISRLGEPYFSTKGEKGTGLGMMSAIQIIEEMNGKLSVTSELNKGTKFEITFPSVSTKI